MSRNKRAVPLERVNLYLNPDIAAQLKLACADLSFGGVKYGEQTRIVNLALRDYFERNPLACTPQTQSPA